MELEMLKQKWEQLDQRLAKVEIMNQKAVRELVSMRTQTSFAKLRNNLWYGALSSIFVTAIMLVVLSHNEVLSDYSINSIIGVMLIGSALALYRAAKATTLNVQAPTAQVMKEAMQLKKSLFYENYVTYALVIGLYILVFYFERSWIIERGRVIHAIVLLIAICVFASFSFYVGSKRQKSILEEIENNLQELNELV